MIIRLFPPILPTRPCEFCLSIQDDSVFVDFDVDDTGQAYIVRISFDGYGCLGIGPDVGRMSKQETGILLDAVAQGEVNTEMVAAILMDYFTTYKKAFWIDAMIEHQLIHRD